MESSCWRDRPDQAVKLHHAAAIVLARWRLVRSVEPDELLQEAWMRWWREHADMPVALPETALPGLLGVARNVVRELRRSRLSERRRMEIMAMMAQAGAVDSGPKVEVELREALQHWLASRLEPKEVEVVLAVRWDGLRWQDAFEELGVTDKAARQALQRKLLRVLSNPRVRKSFTSWMADLGLPFPSLPSGGVDEVHGLHPDPSWSRLCCGSSRSSYSLAGLG